ncbi:Sec63-domain-containing protein [Xylona heveae TC161]|uniref:Sec63-domain-containing protein n=1 Tax=Xylona heveae (strain CBS 132557 / TC161) TaxID=1328760 RepID=A0A165FP84_XYLHT|nr:Sec63-domain-containing protein [Xylona heveae TC161]KZF21219.1 Sec63-domain-containing protein [Xylona heveae TC161]
MSASVQSAETNWLEQLQAMRAAIADLKLPGKENLDGVSYGSDIEIDDEEGNTTESSENASDGIWDLIYGSEDEDADSSDFSDGVEDQYATAETAGTGYDHAWLNRKCFEFAARGQGLDASALVDQILAVLASGSSDEELQMSLADIVGYDDLDFVIDLISHRKDLISSTFAEDKPHKGTLGRLQTKREREESLRKQDFEHKTATLAPHMDREGPQYPHVYKSHGAGNTLSTGGRKYALPHGSERKEYEKYEEYSIPATRTGTVGKNQSLVEIAGLDGLCRGTFKGYKTLNRMQSLVYPVAYKTNENMLICAPTGAGKTDAAMLTILSAVARNCTPSPFDEPDATDITVQVDDFKIVYVAPMKALAAEITEKLGKRLAWLNIKVRELTGDMQLTKAEIVQTQIIVTTPEKWDVVTRKSTGDTELVQKVRLLIIDEVHMLHDERGAVIESLVARTQRQVESTQSLIRIVGLSATLPNYIDVADFLKVNRYAGLFYFDASFRPVPLEQHFVGVRGKPNTKTSKENLEIVSFEKVKEMLELGHQVMVFVHSRKDTVQTARTLYQMAGDQACTDLFDPSDHPRYEMAVKDMKNSKGRELRDLLPKGIGTHHAGMARTDRNLIERLFTEGVLKVLCCTATLAWGVNLPAAAVVIKGTQLYSAQEGKFVDVGILDVLQIFGRAGRPQFQETGIGYICTTHDKLTHYLSAVTQQLPIESKFSTKLVDNLNAEISLGTVTSIAEAVQWIGYSYLFVRMQRNPMSYGIDWAEIRDDPMLVQRRRELAIKAARVLQQSQMIIFNEVTEELRAKDVGRIASQYYILQTSVEIFNTMMRPKATEADILKMLSMSGEFDNIQSRDTESKELSRLREEAVVCQVDAGNDQPHAKTNILLQSYISRARLEDFALVSDSAYVAQNAARICRALFMIALNRGWGHQCLSLLSLCKSIEKQIWPFEHPFHQFDLPQPILRNLDEKDGITSIEALRDMEPAEIGQLVHNQKMGNTISKLLDNFPTLSIDAEIAPLNRDVLRIKLYITPDFRWNDRHHGTTESYWIWVENSETSEIYHHEFFLLSRKKLYDDHELNFTIPLSDPLPTQIYVRAVSDRWLGAETVTPVSFQHLIRPDTESVYTDLLDLQPLPVSALKNPLLEEIYSKRFQFFNPMQTQIFHTMYHTPANVLLGSPTGSGKTIAAELAMWWAFREKPGSKVVYIAPMKALVRERVQDWGGRLTEHMGLKLVELTGDNTPDTRTIRDADIIITTPEKWDGISRSWQTRDYVRKVSLVIIDEIHLLGGDRGPILEIIVSRMNYIASQKKGAVRIVGMSTACANAMDLGNWLGVKEGLFNFRHSVRPVPLEIFIDGFPDQRGFCPFMQSMNRPTFLAIKTHSPEKPVIVFVASRRQTRLTAKDLINFCGMEDNPRRFVRMSEEDLQLNLARVKDEALKEALGFGIGLHHAGLVESDRLLAEELFANNKIQILVATSTLAWGVNLPAHLVVVKGTQFFDAKIEAYKDMDLTDVLQMLGRAGRPQFDSSGIARIFTQDSKKAFYKHFLHTGFPVESTLHKVLDNHLGAEISSGTIVTKQDALDYLTWTFFFRRLHKNPSYYGLEISSEEHNTMAAQSLANDYMIDMVDTSLSELADSGCLLAHSNGDVDPTPLGKIMSYYYLSHKTIRHLIRHAKRNATFEDVLSWMCCATEFDELPVRHNEDLINAELSANLPLKGEALGLPMWDPHVKAHLLLQAFMSRIDLPISDYVGDQNSVLDQSIRIIQASIDVLTEMGFLSSCIMMITLLQCIKSARWPTDGPLSIFPGVDLEKENSRIANPATTSLRTLVEVTSAVSSSPHPVSAAAPTANTGNKARKDFLPLDTAFKVLDVPHSARNQFRRVASILPNIKVQPGSINPPKLDLAIILTRLNGIVPSGSSSNSPTGAGEYRIWAPRFPKPQTEGFFIIVADSANDDILALKRANWPPVEKTLERASQGRNNTYTNSSVSTNNTAADTQEPNGSTATGKPKDKGKGRAKPTPPKPTVRSVLKLPESAAGKTVDIFVISDSYINMTWKIEGVEIPNLPVEPAIVEVQGDDVAKGKEKGQWQ